MTVLCEDATAMSLADAAFDGVVSLTMLHHVPSPGLQARLLEQVARVLRPGGVFVGVDSVYSRSLRLMHLFDTRVLVDPRTFPDRLRVAGFKDIRVDVNPYAFRFFARRDGSQRPPQGSLEERAPTTNVDSLKAVQESCELMGLVDQTGVEPLPTKGVSRGGLLATCR